MAPGAKYRKNGRSGRIDTESCTNEIAWSTRSSVRWYSPAGVGRIDPVVVVGQLGMELVRLAIEKAVVPVETPLAKGHWSNGPAAEVSSIWHRCHLPIANVA